MTSKGYSTRFDKDYSGNHIERLKKKANFQYSGLYINMTKLNCKCCGLKKERTGGSYKNYKFICKQCVDERNSHELP